MFSPHKLDMKNLLRHNTMTITNRKIINSSIVVLLFLMSANSQAKIYKWIDANGQTHYSAQPPKQLEKRIKVKNIENEIKSNAGKYRPSASKNLDTSSDQDEKDENLDLNNGLSGPDKKLVKYCVGQRNNLKQLKKNFRNVWIDAKGKKTNLTQEQRKEKVAVLKKEIDSNCSEVKA